MYFILGLIAGIIASFGAGFIYNHHQEKKFK
jgi:predicted lysophospholipase L1 biosynthesis ABC-type transport system permease subunit